MEGNSDPKQKRLAGFLGFRHEPPGPPRPGKRPGGLPLERHAHVFPGLTSQFVETLAKMGESLTSMEELKSIVSEYGTEYVELVERIEQEGVVDCRLCLKLLVHDDAIRTLELRRDLLPRVASGAVAVLLPLPPHLSATFLSVAPQERVLIIDSLAPRHLSGLSVAQLEDTSLADLEKALSGVEAMLLEAHIAGGRLQVRDKAANLIYLLGKEGLKEVFVHRIPQLPPGARFTTIDPAASDVHVLEV